VDSPSSWGTSIEFPFAKIMSIELLTDGIRLQHPIGTPGLYVLLRFFAMTPAKARAADCGEERAADRRTRVSEVSCYAALPASCRTAGSTQHSEQKM
jgi:hypothetical protein